MEEHSFHATSPFSKQSGQRRRRLFARLWPAIALLLASALGLGLVLGLALMDAASGRVLHISPLFIWITGITLGGLALSVLILCSRLVLDKILARNLADLEELGTAAEKVLSGRMKVPANAPGSDEIQTVWRAFIFLARRLMRSLSDHEAGGMDLQKILDLRHTLDQTLLESPKSTLLHQLCEVYAKAMGATTALIALFDQGTFVDIGYWSHDKEFRLTLKSEADCQKRLAELKTAIVQNTCASPLLGREGSANLMAIPFQNTQGNFGLLEILDKPSGFTTEDLQICAETSHAVVISCNLMIASYRDEKRRITVSQTLRDKERQLSLIADSSEDAIFTAQIDGTILRVNRAGAILMAGVLPDRVVGHKLQDFLLNPRDLETLLGVIRSGRTVRDFELIINKNDSHVFTTASITPIYSDGSDFAEFHAILRDISERVRQSQELIQTNAELSELYRKLQISYLQLVQQEKLASIGQLAAGIAHEINNPLGFLKSNHVSLGRYVSSWVEMAGGTEALNPGQSRLWKDIQEVLGESDEGFERIMNIVKSLKIFSRIDHEGEKIAPVSLNDAIRTTLVVARNEYRYHAEITTDLDDALPDVECQGDQINQVILNLVVNAAQAIKSQKKETPGNIKVSSRHLQDFALIEIADDGPGMTKEICSRIFEPFFTTKDVGEGTGLGLSISHEIVVNKHGGRIEVDTNPGEGTTFKIFLPYKKREHTLSSPAWGVLDSPGTTQVETMQPEEEQ